MAVKRPHWRKMTWVVLAWNALMIAFIIIGVASNNSTSNCGQLGQQLCNQANQAGTVIGVGIIVVIWVIGDIILGILWLVTKGNRRPCPVCGLPVKAGVVQCNKCGHDFRTVAMPSPQSTVAPGWYPDPHSPGQVRWWDGSQWTEQTQVRTPT